MHPHIKHVHSTTDSEVPILPNLEHIVLIRGKGPPVDGLVPYEDFMCKGTDITAETLGTRKDEFAGRDVCNLQYTSGTTGAPKASMLTHQ